MKKIAHRKQKISLFHNFWWSKKMDEPQIQIFWYQKWCFVCTFWKPWFHLYSSVVWRFQQWAKDNVTAAFHYCCGCTCTWHNPPRKQLKECAPPSSLWRRSEANEQYVGTFFSLQCTLSNTDFPLVMYTFKHRSVVCSALHVTCWKRSSHTFSSQTA